MHEDFKGTYPSPFFSAQFAKKKVEKAEMSICYSNTKPFQFDYILYGITIITVTKLSVNRYFYMLHMTASSSSHQVVAEIEMKYFKEDSSQKNDATLLSTGKLCKCTISPNIPEERKI